MIGSSTKEETHLTEDEEKQSFAGIGGLVESLVTGHRLEAHWTSWLTALDCGQVWLGFGLDLVWG